MRRSGCNLFNGLRSFNFELAILLFLLVAQNASSQVTINEVCSSNGNVLQDQNGSTPDWIELYNSSASDIDLTGWFLSDDLGVPTAWAFDGTTIPANGYRIVFCSGDDLQLTEPHTNFKLSKSGETVILSRANGTIEDSVTCGFIPTNQSYGRQQDGVLPFVYYTTPTPRLSNNPVLGTDSYKTAFPTFEKTSGYYGSEVAVTISCETPGSWIHYSTDGTAPDQTYPQYLGPFSVDTNTTIRAVAFSNELFPSDEATVTYLFDDVPSIASFFITTEPGYLFDEDTGIYMMGPNADTAFPYYGANFWQDIEIPVHLQMLEDDGTLVLDQDIGLEIHGGTVSRTREMRSFRLLAKSSYGKNRVRHELFPSKNINDHKRFLLWNSGSDFLQLGYRDGFIQEHLNAHKVNLDIGAYRPSRVYINGAYWGMYNIREKIDRYYIEDNHDVDDKDIDLLEEQDVVVEGSFAEFDAMELYVLNNDLANDQTLEVASGYFDTKNLVDYFACQTILNNADWPWNNLKFWRERRTGAKWRYIIFDLDVVLGGVNFIPSDFKNLGRVLGEYGEGNRHVEIFKRFLANAEFKRYFINRYNDLLNTTFHPNELSKALQSNHELVVDELPQHWARWDGDEERYYRKYDTCFTHIQDRPKHARIDLQESFNLGDEHAILFNVFPEGAGTIDLNSLNLKHFPWSGIYHEGNKVDVAAVANTGSTFSHWEVKGLDLSNNKAMNVQFNPDDEIELVAVFDATFLGMGLSVYPEPAETQITVSVEVPEAGIMTISLVDMNGKEVSRLYSANTLPGSFSRSLQLPAVEQGTYLLTVQGDGFQTSVKLPIIQ